MYFVLIQLKVLKTVEYRSLKYKIKPRSESLFTSHFVRTLSRPDCAQTATQIVQVKLSSNLSLVRENAKIYCSKSFKSQRPISSKAHYNKLVGL